jgi:hypothetical protein
MHDILELEMVMHYLDSVILEKIEYGNFKTTWPKWEHVWKLHSLPIDPDSYTFTPENIQKFFFVPMPIYAF